jgi:hypothetical protein
MPKDNESAESTVHASSSNSTIMDFTKFAAVAVDYFTKWVEAKALVNITTPTIQKFFSQIIICRFGVPTELSVDNGKQSDYYSFKEY